MQLKLSESDERQFTAGLERYGVEVVGGTPEERLDELESRMNGDYVIIDGRNVTDSDEFVIQVLSQITPQTESEISNQPYLSITPEIETVNSGIIVQEFDSMDPTTQKRIAQSLKGVAERMGYEGEIGYTASEKESVVTAEFDLAGRVRTWELE